MDPKIILLSLSILCVSNAQLAVENLDLLGKDILTRTKNIGLNLKDALEKLDPLRNFEFPDFASRKNSESNSHEEKSSEENTSKEEHFSRHLRNNELLSITEDEKPDWIHENQKDWYIKYPACGGVNQSPIDLIKREAKVIRHGDCLHWSNYLNNKFLILNNTGHTIEAQSTFANFFPLPTLEGGPLKGVYNFASMHWHWGRNNEEGSEHTLNSKALPIELHIIHYSSKFKSLTHAIASGKRDALVVVGILFELSSFPTLGMSSLTRSMLKARNQGVQKGALPLGQLGLGFSDGFYTYDGSLTTPPCYPIVRWIIMMKPLPITLHDLKVFRAVKVDGHSLVDNYRTVQPLNRREVHIYNSCRHFR